MYLSEFLKELNLIDEDISIASDNDMSTLTEMSNVRGKSCEVDDIDFSFYFSKKNSNHGIRIKVLWNREKTLRNDDGYMELHGDYRYFSSPKAQYKPKAWEINGLRYFCKKYKVLFAAVWECKLEEDDVADYFKGRVDLRSLISFFDNISEKNYFLVNHCKNLRELEACVRENNIFNMND